MSDIKLIILRLFISKPLLQNYADIKHHQVVSIVLYSYNNHNKHKSYIVKSYKNKIIK